MDIQPPQRRIDLGASFAEPKALFSEALEQLARIGYELGRTREVIERSRMEARTAWLLLRQYPIEADQEATGGDPGSKRGNADRAS